MNQNRTNLLCAKNKKRMLKRHCSKLFQNDAYMLEKRIFLVPNEFLAANVVWHIHCFYSHHKDTNEYRAGNSDGHLKDKRFGEALASKGDEYGNFFDIK
jgi:hypothetical protein